MTSATGVRISPERTQRAIVEQRKLTAEQVRQARLSPEDTFVLAKRFGVSKQLLGKARAGGTYGPLRDDERAAQRRREAPVTERVPFGEYQLIICDTPFLGALDAQDRQEQLDVAHECSHGRLAGDNTPPCGCWPQEQTNPNPSRRNHVSVNHRARVAQFAAQAAAADQGRPVDDRALHPARAA